MALRRSFGPRRDKILGGCRIGRIEKLDNFCSSSDVSRIVRQLGWDGQGM
jgi:hypothetical protein